jgi:hypothetical protein
LKLRTAAAALSIVNGVWSITVGAYWNQVFGYGQGGVSCLGSCIPFGADHIVLVLGVVLLVDSLVCFLAFSRAFYVSAIVSVLILLLVLVSVAPPSQIWANHPTIPATLLLGIATAVLDVVAARRKTYVSEENHPLNLPVFG